STSFESSRSLISRLEIEADGAPPLMRREDRAGILRIWASSCDVKPQPSFPPFKSEHARSVERASLFLRSSRSGRGIMRYRDEGVSHEGETLNGDNGTAGGRDSCRSAEHAKPTIRGRDPVQ